MTSPDLQGSPIRPAEHYATAVGILAALNNPGASAGTNALTEAIRALAHATLAQASPTAAASGVAAIEAGKLHVVDLSASSDAP